MSDKIIPHSMITIEKSMGDYFSWQHAGHVPNSVDFPTGAVLMALKVNFVFQKCDKCEFVWSGDEHVHTDEECNMRMTEQVVNT